MKLLGRFLAFSSVLFASQSSWGSGLYFSDRGVRPLSRAGAFVAGADDLGAIAYNPAGLYDAGAQFLFDASWLQFTSDYTRQAILRTVNPNDGTTTSRFSHTFPSVEGTSPVLPIPTMTVSFQPAHDWVVAAGLWAHYAAIASYPEKLLDGSPAPQRYSLITLDGSALAVLHVATAYAPSKEWRFGLGAELMVGTFDSSLVLGACVPERFFCAPEDPDWDGQAQLSVGPIITPSGNAGAIWIPDPAWRIGASVQLPYYVRAPGTVRTRLPAAPVFAKASQEGDEADVSFDLPWNFRLGVEGRLVPNLRVEVGFAFERWSMHDAITVETDIALKNVAGFPETYRTPDITFARNFQDTVSVRAGGEYTVDIAGYAWDFRAGLSYETSAVPDPYLSVLTIDGGRVTTAFGGSLHVGKWRFDATYAHVFVSEVTVNPEDARLPAVSPVVANPSEEPSYVNGGIYNARANVFGVGLAYTFDPAPADG